jgi:hypothetical protein
MLFTLQILSVSPRVVLAGLEGETLAEGSFATPCSAGDARNLEKILLSFLLSFSSLRREWQCSK